MVPLRRVSFPPHVVFLVPCSLSQYLDGKRANNVSIGLAQFRHLPDGIALAKALLTFNYK